MRILAIDPGPTESAILALDDGRLVSHVDISSNEDILKYLIVRCEEPLVIEKIASMGMAVGAEVFETCYWSGRFAQAYDPSGELIHRITRVEVKTHICGTPRAKDGNVRQAIIDRFGGMATAVGKKRSPGPLYRIKSHAWAALAVGLTFYDRNVEDSKNLLAAGRMQGVSGVGRSHS